MKWNFTDIFLRIMKPPSCFVHQEPVDMEKITLQKEEVEAVEWFDLEEIHEACLTRNPRFCVPIEGLKTLMKYLNLPVSC